jgi:hypothetical protein
VSYDTSINSANTGGPELYAHNRTNFDADATWTGLQPVALTVGYSRNNTGHDFRIFESTGENVFHLTADAVGSQFFSFRANYEYGSRTGSGLNEDLLVEIGEQPDMRHYDVANRTRNKFTGQVDFTPSEVWTFSASAGVGKDDFPDSYFGLEQSSFQTFSLGADFHLQNGFTGGGSYNYEHYSGTSGRRGGATPPQETDPNRDWTVNSKERVNYFSIYATPPKIGENTEARFTTTATRWARTSTQSCRWPVTPRISCGRLQQASAAAHRCQAQAVENLAATFSYLYELFRYDFAFDQTVVNSIVQPSSLVPKHLSTIYGKLVPVRRPVSLVTRTPSQLQEGSC